jgi:uncharacterized protein (DUF305 family)
MFYVKVFKLNPTTSCFFQFAAFGLKNKNKSRKVQAFVQQVEKSVKQQVEKKMKTPEQLAAEQSKKLKEEKKRMEEEMKSLLRSSIKQPKLDVGVDPKSVVCEFFKQGVCEKGDKCKFSHDLTKARKGTKINIYADKRDDDKTKDNISEWDQAKLESVVSQRHGKNPVTTTDIVCMYFLEALEKELYGWFWLCPNEKNGDTCKYRHALPPGYVFKTAKQRAEEAEAKALADASILSIEEEIEEERKKLPTTGLTPVTPATFQAFKERKAKRKMEEMEAKRVEEAKKTGSKGYNALSGRALFTYDPTLFVDDEAADTNTYSERVEVDEAVFAAEEDVDLSDVLDEDEDQEGDENAGEENEDGEENGEEMEEEEDDENEEENEENEPEQE